MMQDQLLSVHPTKCQHRVNQVTCLENRSSQEFSIDYLFFTIEEQLVSLEIKRDPFVLYNPQYKWMEKY